MPTLKNNHWLSIATLILLAANIVTLTMLWTHKKHGDDGKKPPQGPVFEFLTKELQLNEEQQAAFKQLRDQHQAIQNQFRDSTRKAKDALFSLLQQPNVSDSLLQEYSKRATAFDQQLDIVTFRHFQQVRALCNATQQKKFDAIIKDAMSRMGGPGGHPPPGPGAGDHHPPPGGEDGPPPPPKH